ncbi:MAG TPA: alpha/beta hydrolase [Pyrinomonadaceae bacterium]|nr:alpha/beta hydrolase [Pyrinomonadaceae bacterium]
MRKRLLPALLAGLINQFLVAACLGAQASDISGTWIFSITMETGAGDSQRTFALKQQGEKLAGLYLGPFEEKEVTGGLTGNTVMIVVEGFRDNRTLKATYRGTIESPVKMAGAVEYAGDYLARGKWTAVKRDPSAKGKAGEVFIEPATLTTPETGTVYFQLGTLYVPENRADPNSRIIGVGFARFLASQPTGAPPTFHLPGGPGFSYLTGLNQSNRQLRSRIQHIAKYQRVGDVVFVDQRGFSERGDRLMFKYRMPEEPLDKGASLARSTAAFADLARAAVAEFAGKGIDLRGYTVKELADDVNDLRRALGYDRITLVGSSFGSQWSFAVMRRHPDIVMRALLSGVEPLDYGYDMPSHVFAAIQRMWWEAEKDPRLKPYLPEGGLAAAAREVLRRLERGPVKVMVKAPGSKTGETLTITLGPEDFRRSFPKGTNGPAFLISLYHEQYDQWAYSTLAGRRGWEWEFPVIDVLIDTSLGVTPRREYLLRTDAGTEFLGQWNFDSYLATADIWPTQDVGDEFRTEIVSRIPVVFAQGDWDTNTPVENALNIAPYFPNGRLMIATNGGHGVIEPIAAYLPDVFETLLDFLRTGSTANLPARVTLPAPKFDEPDFPPPPPPAKARP